MLYRQDQIKGHLHKGGAGDNRQRWNLGKVRLQCTIVQLTHCHQQSITIGMALRCSQILEWVGDDRTQKGWWVKQGTVEPNVQNHHQASSLWTDWCVPINLHNTLVLKLLTHDTQHLIIIQRKKKQTPQEKLTCGHEAQDAKKKAWVNHHSSAHHARWMNGWMICG